MAKNFNSIIAKVIANKALLRLGIHILATEYLQEGALCFTQVIGDNKEMNEKIKTVSDLKQEVNIKRVCCKKKTDA